MMSFEESLIIYITTDTDVVRAKAVREAAGISAEDAPTLDELP